MTLDDIFQTGTPLPSFVDYQYYKCLENNTILLNDDITEGILELAILPLRQMDADKNVEHITIILNTYGGAVYPGMAFVAALEECTTPITIRIMGVAASMGIYIAMAKSPYITVECDQFSVGLIHAGTYYMSGDRNAARDAWKFDEKYEGKLKKYVLSHTNITEKIYKEIERQEYWMDADTMLKYGIVDRIIGVDE